MQSQRFRLLMGIVLTTFAAIMFTGCSSGDGSPNLGVNNNAFTTVDRVTNSGGFYSPSSAVPDAADQYLYFIANGDKGRGVFKVPATGGAATEVFVGSPFLMPVEITMSTDNKTLFVADPMAGGAGKIFTLSVNGGAPTELAGTTGLKPNALDVIQQGGQDKIYFCGTASNGQTTVYEMPATGAPTPTVRHQGLPLIQAAGIISAKDGTLYITDHGSQPNKGAAYRLAGAAMTQVAGDIYTGRPPGIALSQDEQTVLISSLHPTNGTAQVEMVNLQTGNTSIFNRTIGVNTGAGGLHPARNSSGATGVYAWAGYNDFGDGSVHRLR